MNLFGFEIKRAEPELRASPENPSTKLSDPALWLYDAFGASGSDTGMAVNEETAVRLSAVWGCVRILSESIASLPLNLYRRTANGKEKAIDHPLYWLMHDEPNPDQTSFYFRETKQAHLTLHGNTYSYIEYKKNGTPHELITLPPTSTWPERKNGRVTYRSRINGVDQILQPEQVLHIPALGFDGLMGKSPLRVSMDAVGLGLAAQRFGSKFFANGARLSGVLEHPGKLSDKAKEFLK